MNAQFPMPSPGTRYGRLVLIARAALAVRPSWLCRCDCGVEKAINTYSLRHGLTQSCGCLILETNTSHGHATREGTSRIYSAWRNMWQRCTNQNYPRYDLYGGRGIKVCGRWRSFETFLADMGEPPVGMSIERKKNDRGYEPDNCEWATPRQQTRNRRATKLTYNDACAIVRRRMSGEMLSSIAADYGVAPRTVCGVALGEIWPDALAAVTETERTAS